VLAQWMGDIAGLIPSYILVSIKAGQAYLTLVERERPATISAERLILANMQSMHIELPQGGNGHPRREWMETISGLIVAGIGALRRFRTPTAYQIVERGRPRTIAAECLRNRHWVQNLQGVSAHSTEQEVLLDLGRGTLSGPAPRASFEEGNGCHFRANCLGYCCIRQIMVQCTRYHGKGDTQHPAVQSPKMYARVCAKRCSMSPKAAGAFPSW